MEAPTYYTSKVLREIVAPLNEEPIEQVIEVYQQIISLLNFELKSIKEMAEQTNIKIPNFTN